MDKELYIEEGEIMKSKLVTLMGAIAVLSFALFLFFLFSRNQSHSIGLPIATLCFTFSAQYRSVLKSGKTFNEYFFQEEFRRKHNLR
jgi:hypothetical protein